MTKFSTVMALIAAALTFHAVSGVAQQDYPRKPVRLICLYPPGGGADVRARLLAPKLTESLGQPVFVDNRPGGNTIIGTEALVRSAPDGYTLLSVVSEHVLIPLLYKTSYDPIKDFAPVGTIDKAEPILVMNAAVPAENLQEFIALAKSKPGQLNSAIPSAGGIYHVMTELFSMMAGINMQTVPYKGAAPALIGVVAGQAQLYLGSVAAVLPHVRSGKLKGIAISGENRASALPQVPTFAQAGMPDFNVKMWSGLLAPAGTPKAIIDKLSAELARILALPDYKEKLAAQGMEPFVTTPDQFAALMKVDMAKFAQIVKNANIKIE